MNKHVVVGVSILALSLFIACQPAPVSEISVDDILGVWRMEVSGEAWGPFLFINEDGTYIIAGSKDPDDINTYDFGQYELEGDSITFQADKESQGCPGYRTWVAIELIESEKLQFRVLDEECPSTFPVPNPIFVGYSP
jgi:hypothetical protein